MVCKGKIEMDLQSKYKKIKSFKIYNNIHHKINNENDIYKKIVMGDESSNSIVKKYIFVKLLVYF